MINGHQLQVEIASNPHARSCGLSLRDSLPAGHGMLFVYQDDQIREFWMRNTLIPLELAYLDSHGKIQEINRMSPHEPNRIYRSALPARYALETHPDWPASKGVRVGDTAELRLPKHLDIR